MLALKNPNGKFKYVGLRITKYLLFVLLAILYQPSHFLSENI